jgi:hypothetical protein
MAARSGDLKVRDHRRNERNADALSLRLPEGSGFDSLPDRRPLVSVQKVVELFFDILKRPFDLE